MVREPRAWVEERKVTEVPAGGKEVGRSGAGGSGVRSDTCVGRPSALLLQKSRGQDAGSRRETEPSLLLLLLPTQNVAGVERQNPRETPMCKKK